MGAYTIQSLLTGMDWKSKTRSGCWPVLQALERCRTESLGWHLMQCDNDGCHDRTMVYHSCRNRHCPQCGFARQESWIESRMEELLPCNYFHVVFTLPHELNVLCLANRKFFYDLLFRASSETIKAFCGRAGSKTSGMIAVLHTWGQQLSFHPHVHLLVSGGGTDKAGRFSTLAKANGYYLFSAKAMRSVYRSIVLKALYEAIQGKELVVPESQMMLMTSLLKDLKEKEWIVYAKRPFAGPSQVIAYLGRYTHRVAISNHRIEKITDREVMFWYKDYADGGKRKRMVLSKEEFLRRFVQHILPPRYMKIRSYGLFGNYNRKRRLTAIREQNKFPNPLQSEPIGLDRWLSRYFRSQIGICSCCQRGKLQTIDVVLRKRNADNASWMRPRRE